MNNWLNSYKRSKLLDNFIKKTIHDNHLDLKQFWKIREFYSTGQYTFNNKIIDVQKTFTFISNDKGADAIKIFNYNAPLIRSFDYLVKKDIPNDIILAQKIDVLKNFSLSNDNNQNLLQTHNTLIKRGNNFIKIIFIRNLEEMKDVFGFSDFNKSEMEIIQDYKWLNITTFYYHSKDIS